MKLTMTKIRQTWPRGDPLRELWERHWAVGKALGLERRGAGYGLHPTTLYATVRAAARAKERA